MQLAYAYLETGNLELAFFHAGEVCKYKQHLPRVERIMSAPMLCQVLLRLAQHSKMQQDIKQAQRFAEIAIEFATEAKESELVKEAEQFVATIQDK